MRYETIGTAYFEFKKANLAGGTQDEAKLGYQRKILMRKTGFPLCSTLDSTGIYPEQSLYFLYDAQYQIELEYVLGILNSKLFQYVFMKWMVTNRDTTPQLKKVHLDEFPLRTINFNDRSDIASHDEIVELVIQMLEWKERLRRANTPQEQIVLEREINVADSRIDHLVCELYGVDEGELNA
jgi:hypothetical protein